MALALARQIFEQDNFAYRIVGFAAEGPMPAAVPPGSPGYSGPVSETGALVTRYGVDRIIVAVSDRRGHLPVDELVLAKLSGVEVEEAATTYERLTGKLMLENIKPSSVIFSNGFRVSRWRRTIKRAADVVFSLVGIVLSAVPMALTAVAVWLESGAPVIYRQERVGQHGRTFTLLKFRSMRTDAEADRPIWAQRVGRSRDEGRPHHSADAAR